MTAAVTENNGAGSGSSVAGRVVRVIGPVVDVEFPRGAIPELFNALHAEITLPSVAKTLTLESHSTSATTWCAPSRCSPPTA